jgi:hypothetical protein
MRAYSNDVSKTRRIHADQRVAVGVVVDPRPIHKPQRVGLRIPPKGRIVGAVPVVSKAVFDLEPLPRKALIVDRAGRDGDARPERIISRLPCDVGVGGVGHHHRPVESEARRARPGKTTRWVVLSGERPEPCEGPRGGRSKGLRLRTPRAACRPARRPSHGYGRSSLETIHRLNLFGCARPLFTVDGVVMLRRAARVAGHIAARILEEGPRRRRTLLDIGQPVAGCRSGVGLQQRIADLTE